MAVISSLTVTEQVMLLPVEERIKLVEKLLSSLNGPRAPEIESAWIAQAERRSEAVLTGEEETFPHEEVIADLRAGLQRL